MSTFLEIGRAVAVEMGVEIPSSMVGDDPDAIKMNRFINEAGLEIARRVDWHVLRRTFTITGDGSDRFYDLAPDHARLEQGLVVSTGGQPVRGGLTSDEWMALTMSQGAPRYFMAAGRQIRFYPYPAGGTGITVSYQSRNWAESAGGTGRDALTVDSDVVRLPSPLFERGAVWRWMRHVGRDYGDQMAEFEAQLADYASADGAMRLP